MASELKIPKELYLKSVIFQREVIIITKSDLLNFIDSEVRERTEKIEKEQAELLIKTADEEREACAKVAERCSNHTYEAVVGNVVKSVAKDIRNRTQIK